ncbi:hypothetical protein Ancab_015376, partial [Ancistrocladus abbreviatus]
MALDVPVSDTAHFRLLKLGMLFGSLTLQDTQSAVDASDFASVFRTVNLLGDLGDISTGFASAFLLIFFSELGDKTFFIAVRVIQQMSLQNVFAMGKPLGDIELVASFGVSALIDASFSEGLRAEEEWKEVEQAVSEFSGKGARILAAASTVISNFLLGFVAEWGDKSFFSIIALAAASSPLRVIGGALAGHGAATLIAVSGGSLLGAFLSEKSAEEDSAYFSDVFAHAGTSSSSALFWHHHIDRNNQRLEIGHITSRGRNELHVVVKNSSDIEIG